MRASLGKAGRSWPVLALLLALLVTVAAGCPPGQISEKEQEELKKVREAAHTITDEELQPILKDVREDLEIIESARSDTPDLEKALISNALKNTRADFRKDKAAGRVKIRDWRDEEFEFKNKTSDIVGITFIFNDFSYYVDAETGEKLTKPEETPYRFALAVKEEDGRWKIQGIYSSEAIIPDPDEEASGESEESEAAAEGTHN